MPSRSGIGKRGYPMRERAYVHVARLSGASNFKIIFLELMPNLLPYLAASLVAIGATSPLLMARAVVVLLITAPRGVSGRAGRAVGGSGEECRDS